MSENKIVHMTDHPAFTQHGPRNQRASLYAVVECATCKMPVFVHTTYGDPELKDKFFLTCTHDPPESLMVEYPATEDIKAERAGVQYLFDLLYQAIEIIGDQQDQIKTLQQREV